MIRPVKAIQFVLSVFAVFGLLQVGLVEAAPNDKNAHIGKYKEDEVLVKFKLGVSREERETAHMNRGSKKMKDFSRLGIHQVKVKKGMSVEDAIKQYKSDPSVEYAEPNYLMELGAPPSKSTTTTGGSTKGSGSTTITVNDPYFSSLWALNNPGRKTTAGVPYDIDALAAWKLTTGSSNNVVAVIDTGIDYLHQDLTRNMWMNNAEFYGMPGFDDDGNGYVDDVYGIDTANDDSDPMDDHSHGTHVAGTIGATANNGIGVVGVNWNVQIMSLKFLSSSGSGYTSDAIACLEYVRTMKDRGVNIIATNNSWGGGGYSQALYDAITAQQDILFVAAAGNSGIDNDLTPHYPSSYNLPNVLSVAAVDSWGNRASFSNYGKQTVDVAAPGYNIYSTTPGNTYNTFSGTSMATPHVTGLAALILAKNPGRSCLDVKSIIMAGGELLSATEQALILSRKRINAAQSLMLSSNQIPIAEAGSDQTVYEGDLVYLDGSASHDLDGTMVSYSWRQIKGSPVELYDADTAFPNFTAPNNGEAVTELIFVLAVTDNVGLTSSDTVTVDLLGVNDAPNYTGADIITYVNRRSNGIIPEVIDPDPDDTYTFSIVTQPSFGVAEVIDNMLYYIPNSGYLGTDSFTFLATDSGGLSVEGVAYVEVEALNYDPNTVLLIHSDTFDGDTSFMDSSINTYPVNVSTGPYHSTDTSKFWSSSIKFNSNENVFNYGATGKLSISNIDYMKNGLDDLTIDFWFKSGKVPLSGDESYFTLWVDNFQLVSGIYTNCGMYYASRQGHIKIWWGPNASTTVPNTSASIPFVAELDEWYHVAFVKSGLIGKLFINGLQIGQDIELPDLGGFIKHAASLGLISGQDTDAYYFIDEYHISSSALWTENFTPPSAPWE